MSADSNLQEMENAVTKGLHLLNQCKLGGVPYEDLGGPTPETPKPDDDSNKLKGPGATLKQVRDVVNSKAQAC